MYSDKFKLRTPHSDIVTDTIDKWKFIATTEETKIFKVLTNIRNKNIKFIQNKQLPTKHNNLIGIISNPFILIAAYRTIRVKKGALTPGAFLPTYMQNKLNQEQLKLIKSATTLPDGMNWEVISTISSQLKQGTYPWGSSRRIWIPKPGIKDKLRPITIPPFCDKLVQEAIRMVLEAIYEPRFMHMNVSFGFRASNGCHECIELIKSKGTGFTTAIEGDIEQAYPNLNNSILLKILSESIADQKFLNLMRERLTLTLFDTKDRTYTTSFLGIPQGGIDSPYLFNIYLLGMDQFVMETLTKQIDHLNTARLISKKTNNTLARPAVNTEYKKYKNAVEKQIKQYKIHKAYYKQIKASGLPELSIKHTKKASTYKLTIEKEKMFNAIKKAKKLKYLQIQTQYRLPEQKLLRFVYTRYADDFIIIGNFSNKFAQDFKEQLKYWLSTNRDAKLSEQKTTITNLLEEPAKFLGFEIKGTKHRKYTWVRHTKNKVALRRTAGAALYIGPDRVRMINRLYIKGYCNKKGYPIHIPWLSCFEPHIIIKKFNDVMTGFAQYYTSFISNKALLSRWLYIIRFSALKTLAQKYNTKISKIYKKFLNPQTNQISASYLAFAKDEQGNIITLKKTWTLLSQKQAIDSADNNRNIIIGQKLQRIAKGEFVFTELTDPLRTPRIMDADFLNRINWVNFRTQAQFDMPCVQCGATENIEMHHIKAIRKSKYSIIPQANTLQRLLSLRNRKQVPICINCHQKIHFNKNNATFNLLSPVLPLFDNRILDSERFIQPGKVYQSLPLVEDLQTKGWKITKVSVNNNE